MVLVSGNKVFVLCVECQMEWKEPQPQSTDYPNVSLMVTYDRIALISGDPRWLLSRQVHFRTWGVALLSVQLIVNLVSLVIGCRLQVLLLSLIFSFFSRRVL